MRRLRPRSAVGASGLPWRTGWLVPERRIFFTTLLLRTRGQGVLGDGPTLFLPFRYSFLSMTCVHHLLLLLLPSCVVSILVCRGIASHVGMATRRPLSSPRPVGLSSDLVPFFFYGLFESVILIQHYMRVLCRVGHLLPFPDSLAFYRTEAPRGFLQLSPASPKLKLLDMTMHKSLQSQAWVKSQQYTTQYHGLLPSSLPENCTSTTQSTTYVQDNLKQLSIPGLSQMN